MPYRVIIWCAGPGSVKGVGSLGGEISSEGVPLCRLGEATE